ncbi:AfsR/SARP family transcriptional regulator [Streptomyces sp. NEAU-NA10]|uniref:AfsR/SARP family transcriptional regulator n=1 Tax=Streptomyces sp. NEAU-NA10 TaxID=3416050 RepID=UPI003CC68ACC
MRYRILGTTQALRPDGTPVAVGGARLRALLTVLALRAGRTVPAGMLVEEVWAGEPPADATGALQALVGRLRRALGADAVASVDGGYRLTAAPDAVDLHRFERLADDGRRALTDGDPAKAAVLLDDALALWQGPALADLPDRASEAARREARRLDAVRARHTAALALGHAEQSLPELTALCDAHPLDEPLQALRLRALRDAGRTAEALAAYEDVRRLLADRLGSDPGPELRSLHAALLTPAELPRPAGDHLGPDREDWGPGRDHPGPGRERPGPGRERPGPTAFAGSDRSSGGPDRSSSGPVRSSSGPVRSSSGAAWSSSGSGRPSSVPAGPSDGAARPWGDPAWPPADSTRGSDGPAHSPGGSAHPPTASAQPPAASAPPRGNLRARLTSFVGREADIEAIRGDLAAARLVTLLGPGGAGKTRLSQEAAETVGERARDGVWLAELAPVADPDAVPQAVLTALGARETVLYGAGAEEMRSVAERHDDPVERLVEHCARRRMLIVLDNCEHVVEAAARLVDELLRHCPELTVLATSREPLGIPGEVLRPVEPLPEPVALRLFADRGAAARPGFRVDDDPEACAEICRRLDGLPLAIELAAARLRMLTPRQIADRLDDRFRLLTSGSRTVLPRQQTLRAVVDWSWDLLDEEEREVLGRLSVFARGCDLAAAEAVCGPAALDALGSLVDKSLVVAAPAPDGAMRYRLLETVAEYAGERLDESGGRPSAERAHLTYYRELARTTEPLLRGPEQRAAIDRFQLEYENLRTALRRAVAVRDEQEGLCLVLSLVWYWTMRDLRIEARTWCREVMSLGPDPFAEPVRPAAPVWRSCTDDPPPMTGEVLAEARRGVHLAHLSTMDTELDAWQTPAAQNKLRVIGDTYTPGLPQTCRIPGLLWFYAVLLTGDMDRIHAIADANVETCRSTPGYEWELASCLQLRANLLANRSDWAGDAGRDADEALEAFRRLGDAWGAAEALSARAEARERLGAHREAAADYEEAVAQAERLGARHQVAVLEARLGSALLEAGEEERGERLLREVIDNPYGIANEAMPAARLFLAGHLGLTGRRAEAREQLRLLREEFGIAHFVFFDALILGAEAWVEAADGCYDDSLAMVRKALERAGEKLSLTIAPHMRSFYLYVSAMALTGADGGRRAEAAARCLGTADALLPERHVAVRLERTTRTWAVTAARAVLGDEAYEAAYAEGGGLSYEEAAALV